MVNPTATPRTPPPIASATLRLLRWIVLGFLAINMSSTFLTPYPTGIPLWLFAGLGAWMTAASVLALYRPQLGALAAIVPIGSTLVVGRYGQDIAPTVIIAATVCALASARAAILTIAALLTYVGALRYVGLDLDGVATYLLLILVPAGIGCVVRGLLAFSRRVQVRISDLEARAVQLRLEERSTLADELSALLSQGLAVQQITLDEARRGTDPAVLRGNLLAVEHHARESLAQLRGLVSTLRGREASTPTTGTPTLTASAEEVEDLLVGHGHPVVLDVPASEELVGDFTRRTLGDVLRRAGPLVAAQAPPGVECVVSVSVAADMVTVELAHPLGDQPMADDAAALGDSARLSASLRHDQEAVLAAGGTFSAGTQGDGWALRAALPQRASAVAPGGRVPAGDASRPGLGRVVLRVGLLRWGAALVLVVGTVLLAGRASAALHTGSADWPTAALWALLCAALAVACWRVRPAVPLLALVLLLGLVASPASPVFAQPPHVAGIALAAILCAGHRRWVWAILLGWTAYTILWFRGELTLDSFGAMLVSPFLGIALGLPAHHFLQLRVEQQRQLAAADWHHRQAREEVRHELAGELHDIVAHQLSLITMQVQAHRGDASAERLLAGLTRIATINQSAQADLALLLHVMRSDAPSPVVPAPGSPSPGSPSSGDPSSAVGWLSPSSAIRAAAATLHDAGHVVALDVNNAADLADATTQKTVTRVIREATTNILRYAPELSPCALRLGCDEHTIQLEITNPMPEVARRSEDSTGLGLIGLDERVRITGGTLTAGPAAGQWRVAASVPMVTTVDLRPRPEDVAALSAVA